MKTYNTDLVIVANDYSFTLLSHSVIIVRPKHTSTILSVSKLQKNNETFIG